MRRTTAANLGAGPLADGLWEPLELQATWTATAPPFVYGSADLEGQCWGSGHYEQPGAITGTIRAADAPAGFSGLGYRDHSRGPRDLSQLGEGGVFCHGEFESGQSFVAVDVNGGRWAARYGPDDVEPAKLLQAPLITPPTPDAPCPVVIEGTSGRAEIDVVPTQAVRFSIVDAGEFVCGRASDGYAFFECPIRCEWDGERGTGTVERVYREGGRGAY